MFASFLHRFLHDSSLESEKFVTSELLVKQPFLTSGTALKPLGTSQFPQIPPSLYLLLGRTALYSKEASQNCLNSTTPFCQASTLKPFTRDIVDNFQFSFLPVYSICRGKKHTGLCSRLGRYHADISDDKWPWRLNQIVLQLRRPKTDISARLK